MAQLKYRIQKNLRMTLIRETELKKSQEFIRSLDVGFPESIPMPEIQDMPIYGYTLKEVIENNLFLTPNVFIASLQNVIYYPEYDSIFTNTSKLISDSVMNHFKPEKYSLRKLYFSRKEEISGPCGVFRSIFNCHNYYHSLIDYLPRIYLLHCYQKQIKSERIKLLVPDKPTKTEEFFLDKLLPEDIEVVSVKSDKLFRIDNLLLPSFLTHKNHGYLPDSYLSYFQKRVLPKHSRNKKNLIYISRRFLGAGSTRCILNEEELLGKLRPYGFKKYYLEDLSIREQIELFYHASFVVSPHGAGLANIIFAEAINILEIFPGSCLLPHYYLLSKSLGHNYTYWCGKSGTNKDANFLVDTEEILAIVKHLL